MKPSCDTVEYASTRLMSFCPSAMIPASSAVVSPTPSTTLEAPGATSKTGSIRATR